MSGRGHRTLPHTADVIVEAWGPDLATCVEEATAAMVGTCLDTGSALAVGERTVRVASSSPEQAVLDALDEVIFALDTSPHPPIGARVRDAGDGSLVVTIALADPGSVEHVGAAPKAISRSGLTVATTADGVRCRVLVDV